MSHFIPAPTSSHYLNVYIDKCHMRVQMIMCIPAQHVADTCTYYNGIRIALLCLCSLIMSIGNMSYQSIMIMAQLIELCPFGSQ